MNRRNSSVVYAIAAGIFLSLGFVGQAAEAAPQPRLRRWIDRAPIDPTIRQTPSFGQPQSTSRRYYSPRSVPDYSRRYAPRRSRYDAPAPQPSYNRSYGWRRGYRFR